MRFPLEQEKIRPSRHLVQLSIWTTGLGILDIDTQLNSLKIKHTFRKVVSTSTLKNISYSCYFFFLNYKPYPNEKIL